MERAIMVAFLKFGAISLTLFKFFKIYNDFKFK